MAQESGAMAQVSGWSSGLKFAALVAIIVVGWLIARETPAGDYISLAILMECRNALSNSAWAPLVFVVIYSSATAFALPGSVLTIAGGAIFGFWWGALLNSIGANIGANAAFWLARTLGRDGAVKVGTSWLSRWLGADGVAWGEKLGRSTEKHGFMGLLVLRLVPLVPFNALNFGSGFTRLRWYDYAFATVVGILPGTLVYTFFADALVLGSTEASSEARTRLWIAAGMMLALSSIPLIARKLGFKLPSHSSSEGSQ